MVDIASQALCKPGSVSLVYLQMSCVTWCLCIASLMCEASHSCLWGVNLAGAMQIGRLSSLEIAVERGAMAPLPARATKALERHAPVPVLQALTCNVYLRAMQLSIV